MGNSVVNVFGFPPVKSKHTPSFKVKSFTLETTNQLLSEGKYFNEGKVYYSLKDRNKFIVTPPERQEEDNQKEEDLIRTIQSFEVDVNVTDFEIIASSDEKVKIYQAIEKRDFRAVCEIAERLVDRANELNIDEEDKQQFIELYNLAVQLKEYVNDKTK